MKLRKFIAFLTASIAVLCMFTACDSSDYKKAVKLMDSGNYEEAKAIFTEIKDYKDSAELINECEYSVALNLMNNGDYSGAKGIFTSLGNYKDSVSLIYDCNWEIVLDYYINSFRKDENNSVFEIETTTDYQKILNITKKYNNSDIFIETKCFMDASSFILVQINVAAPLTANSVGLIKGDATTTLLKNKINNKLDWIIKGAKTSKKLNEISDLDWLVGDFEFENEEIAELYSEVFDNYFKDVCSDFETVLKESDLKITFEDLGIC